MLADRLSDRLHRSKQLRENMSLALRDAAAMQVGGDPIVTQDFFVEIEGELLSAASVFAYSSSSEDKSLALQLSHYILGSEFSTPQAKQYSMAVLEKLGNHVSVELARRRANGNDVPLFSGLDFPSQLEAFGSLIGSTRHLPNGERVVFNAFQNEVWDGLDSSNLLSISAPTSAGKSFVLELWLVKTLILENRIDVGIIVPTRALIYQFERDLRKLIHDNKLTHKVNLTTVPSHDFFDADKSNVYVFTQERLNIFQERTEDASSIQCLIVDEAQKIGDDARGVLLQRVVERQQQLSHNLRIIYLSPNSENPGIFLDREQQGVVVESSVPMVAQNVFWAVQDTRSPARWQVSAWLDDELDQVATIQTQIKSRAAFRRLAGVAAAVGGTTQGNLVYTNTADMAEKSALLIFNLLGEEADIENDELDSLIEFVEHAIHKRYSLVSVLRRGIAFHYGNMPLLVRSEIERLFSEGIIRYLICTSTLVEGVNTSCRNIFLRGPKKGLTQIMKPVDVWNLAGRAGRWGKEFEGNIFCIDTDDVSIWHDGEPPRRRSRYRIQRSTSQIGSSASDLAELFTPPHEPGTRLDRTFESNASYLFTHYCENGELGDALLDRFEVHSDERKQLRDAVAGFREKFSLPDEIVIRNPGISPVGMQMLFDYFCEEKHPAREFLPLHPSVNDSANRLGLIFGRTHRYLSSELGPRGRSFGLAYIVTDWMRGKPISQLIQQAVRRRERAGEEPRLATVIRKVLEDIEKYARYQAPKYVSCYSDILTHWLRHTGESDLETEIEDFTLNMEFGVNTKTQIALMSLGLSRTAALLISEVLPDDWSRDQSLSWLQTNQYQRLSIPGLVTREIEDVLSWAS